MFGIERDVIESAYLKLKQENYYDTINHFLRDRIALFEQEGEIGKSISAIENYFNDPLESFKTGIMGEWLDKISFRIMPKSVKTIEEFQLSQAKPDERTNSNILTNIRSSSEYVCDEVQYFIDAPIELHIIDTLWAMTCGKVLDDNLGYHCVGNRLLSGVSNSYLEYGHLGLFKLYHKQYNKWRDSAINAAEKALEGKTDIIIIAMDIKQFYYNIETDWERILGAVEGISGEWVHLCNIVKNIHRRFHDSISNIYKLTHAEISEKVGLPIGLYSSSIITNFTLNDLDELIVNSIEPIYYGRYVDDMLIVAKSTTKVKGCESKKDIVEQILNSVPRVENNNDGDVIYKILGLNKCNLEVQSGKLIVQHYNHEHSYAGLKKFKKQIEDQTSEFRFLPEDDELVDLEECAFDVIYEGSINKFRSVIGISENSTELSKYLSRRIIRYRLCEEPIKDEHIAQLFKFYHGKNIFNFYKLWEKVFSLLLISNKEIEIIRFFKKCFKVIGEVRFVGEVGGAGLNLESEVSEYLKRDLCCYLNISLSTTVP